MGYSREPSQCELRNWITPGKRADRRSWYRFPLFRFDDLSALHHYSLENSLQCSGAIGIELSFAAQEVTLEGSVEDCWIDPNLLDRAAGGAALHWFRT